MRPGKSTVRAAARRPGVSRTCLRSVVDVDHVDWQRSDKLHRSVMRFQVLALGVVTAGTGDIRKLATIENDHRMVTGPGPRVAQ